MSNELLIEPAADGAILAVKVVPGASRDEIVGALGSALKVKVTAPAEKGKANEAVCSLLAGALAITKAQVQVLAGHTQPNKRIALQGVSVDKVRQLTRGQQ